MSINCLLCGVGGQGTVLAARLIALAAMDKGEQVRTAETIGMAQRGGCVVSHVRTGPVVHSSLIPLGGANLILAFEPAEAVRCLPYLKQGGAVVVSRKAVKPVTASLTGSSYDGSEMLAYLEQQVPHLVVVDGDAVCRVCGSPKVLNVALLAAAVKGGLLDLTVEELRQAVARRVPERFHALNFRAIDAV